MADKTPDFLEILQVLDEHDVDFIVVGALSAVLQGAPIMTMDLDIVHDRSPANVERLAEALDQLEARFRGHPDQKLRPETSHLESEGHQLLTTRYGPLDVLGTIEGGRGYDALIEQTTRFSTDELSVSVLRLETYVELKEQSDRETDRARLPTLRRTLKERGDDEGSE